MFHMWRDEEGKKWRAELLSSLPGYEGAIGQEWPLITEGLASLSGEMALTGIEVDVPRSQPVQRNVDDCGVLLLCAARWIAQGWPLRSLRAADCPELRERMVVEIHKWRLD